MEIQNEIEVFNNGNRGQYMYHGEFLTDDGELKELYMGIDSSLKLYLLSTEELVDFETAKMVLYSIRGVRESE